ncbi:carbohydrate esterase family 15 protein [Macrolepiota fuliginosa MF-IS2]|uniref:(4-O-methyl)-D-glucuronate--lignin esterase n=1 Tax=Macrolepiota fuliginosa MF-IS2 TaxID=1400762 RepID=A0A9P5XDG6_9AGAR|nr:carbohydrate esterase family 15 protein [Macrolepiota fuliginosa MF-IS2]
MSLRLAFVTLVFVLPTFAQSALYAQCGGTDWTGATTCVAGATCTYVNDYYSQCLPATSTTTTPSVTPSTTTTTPIIPSTTTTTSTSSILSASTGCPTLPSNPSLTANSKLPNPFKFFSGASVTTKADWQCRREELFQLLQTYELGTLPPKPQTVSGSLSSNTLTINVSDSGKSISFSVSISYPSSGTAPYPGLIAYGGLSFPAPAGVAVITFNNDDVAAQVDSTSRGQGKFYTLYGSGHSAGALTAWAWGVSRIIDVLETTADTKIDLTKIGVTGCSRNGKGALVAGAFDTRIALTIPQESGSGGAGSWRISDAVLQSGTKTQTASEIIGEDVWFSKNFEPYVDQVNVLPFDHHLLAALVAPRALFVIDHSTIDWLGPRSVWGCMKTANKIWQALGVADSMGISQAGNHDHCAFPSVQQADLDAFVNKFLKGQSTDTNIIKTDGANELGYVESDWVDWTVPTLS